jgi:hypothetical protein
MLLLAPDAYHFKLAPFATIDAAQLINRASTGVWDLSVP